MIPSSQLLALVTLLGSFTGAQSAAIQTRASSGCARGHDWAGQTRQFSFDSSGGTRTYRIHLPNSYNNSTAKPLLIAYHGRGDNPSNFESTTRFSDPKINPDMIVVYPAGVNGAWEGPSYAASGVSDKVFTTDLVNRIKNNYCVDESRVYGSGHSNGGGFMDTLACSPGHGGDFAALAPVSGAFYTDATADASCHPANSPIPIFETHGLADPQIPYHPTKNGDGGPLPDIAEWVGWWKTRNQCDGPNTIELGNGVHDMQYNCQGRNNTLRHIRIDSLDHTWPGPNNSPIDISPVIIKWLSSITKP